MSMSAVRRLLIPILLCALQVSLCNAACAEVDSDTEAVVGAGFKVGCISCKMRGEVEGSASIDWFFRAKGEQDFLHIYNFEDKTPTILDDRFEDRLDWNGSKNTDDIQDASVYILNVTFNDSGTYRCLFNRVLTYPYYEYSTKASKLIHLTVVAKATRGTASIVSEVMMYVSIIGLQLWLLVEMIYCYRKISAAGEEALRESAAEYLAIASESKDNCAGVQVAE
ncbi:sodium channel subunit beta-1-like [Anguilla rostrata]|uniref:sodium channel subunit beta-1-like n=1 Tax=Anguilla rostrata TaxID=7938 RepID=UPI0030CDD075